MEHDGAGISNAQAHECPLRNNPRRAPAANTGQAEEIAAQNEELRYTNDVLIERLDEQQQTNLRLLNQRSQLEMKQQELELIHKALKQKNSYCKNSKIKLPTKMKSC